MAVTRYVLPSPEGAARVSFYMADTVGELPTTMTAGDLAFSKDNTNLYRCTTTNQTWTNTGGGGGVAMESYVPLVVLSTEVTF